MRTALLSLSSIAFAAITSLASAQPMSDRSMSDFTWSGPYIGLNAGAVLDGKTRFDRTTGSSPNNNTALTLGLRPTEYKIMGDGFTGGAQIGMNFDTGDFGNWLADPFGARLVMGIEADAAYTDLDRTDTLSNTTFFGPLGTPSATAFTRINRYSSDLKYLGTARGRLGLAFDNTLIYGTGGLAYGDVRNQVTFFGPNAPTEPFFQGSNEGMRSGYTFGGGVEFAMPVNRFFNMLNFFNSTAVTLKAEYLHYDLGNDTFTVPGVNSGAALGSYTTRVRTYGDVVRAGINYKL